MLLNPRRAKTKSEWLGNVNFFMNRSEEIIADLFANQKHSPGTALSRWSLHCQEARWSFYFLIYCSRDVKTVGIAVGALNMMDLIYKRCTKEIWWSFRVNGYVLCGFKFLMMFYRAGDCFRNDEQQNKPSVMRF